MVIKMRKQYGRGWIFNYICILAILCAFAISALVLINVGVHVYKNITVKNSETFSLRTSLSYIATKIRQSDSKDKIYLSKKKGISVLTLEEVVKGVTYETLIYYDKGKLYELYQEKGKEFKLSDGMEVMQLADMQFEMVSGKLMKVTAKSASGNSEELLMCIRTE
jgi:hypothetical protein